MKSRPFDIKKDKLDFRFDYNSKETQNLKEQLEKKEKVTVDDLRRITLWKLDRVLEISDDALKNLNTLFKTPNLKYTDDITKNVINELTKCKGIGFPMLSAILKFLRPEIFPIIDVRAYRALYGKKITQYQYTIKVYMDYIEKIYQIKEALNIELDKIDEQLYMFDKKNNGKI